MSRVTHLLSQPATLLLRTYQDDDSGEGSYLEEERAVLVYIEQQGPSEHDEGAPASSTLRLIMENIAELDYLSGVRVDGRLLELQGPPWRVWDPRRAEYDHAECQVRWAA